MPFSTVAGTGMLDSGLHAVPDYSLEEAESPTYEKYAQEHRRSTLTYVAIGVAILMACMLVSGIGVVAAGLYWYNSIVPPWQPPIDALATQPPRGGDRIRPQHHPPAGDPQSRHPELRSHRRPQADGDRGRQPDRAEIR